MLNPKTELFGTMDNYSIYSEKQGFETKKRYSSSDYYLTEERVYISDMTYMHGHTHYELYFLLSGEQKYFIKNRYYDMQEGDVILIPAGTMHKTTQGMGGKRILFDFNEFFLSKFLSKRAIALLEPLFKQKLFHPTRENTFNLQKIFREIANAQRKGDEDQIFVNLMRIFIFLSESPVDAVSDYHNKRSFFDAVVDFVHNHYDTIKGLEDVADALFVSKYYVCHLFTKYMGTSFNNYLTDLRLKKAEQFVAYSNRSINEISTLCGFRTTTYFCRVFKQRYHYSPLVYRKNKAD